MQIDWTTFLLEIVNFLALVWLLQRFLYRPVLAVLAQRRAAIEQVQAAAHASEANASALRDEFEHRLADWEAEKASARSELDAELAQARAEGLQAIARTLADERQRNAAIEAHWREQVERDAETQAMAQARRYTAALLGRLASPALDASLLEVFLAQWAALPDAELHPLRLAASVADAVVHVSSAFPLAGEQRQTIESALTARLQSAIAVAYGEDSELIAGLRVALGDWHLDLNIAAELARFANLPDDGH